tara:strand:- start:566 stop:745 length:180 start_codon:yes stop_codon:yes gene_type:complete
MQYNKIMIKSATGQHMIKIIEHLLLIVDEDKARINSNLIEKINDLIEFNDNSNINRTNY